MPPVSRIPAPIIESDRAALRAISDMGDYAPMNAAYSTPALQELERACAEAQQDEIRSRRAADVARDRAVEAERRFHEALVGAKIQVVAQYGQDSSAVEAIGFKKKSERRRPSRRAAAG
jgi:hypothetical protein